jgi:hypothetical protein
MPVVALFLALVAGHGDLLRVHHDHEVTHVAVGRVLGLALPAQRVGELGGQPPQRLAGGVDHEPVALALGRCGYVGLHRATVKGGIKLSKAPAERKPSPTRC